MCLTALSANAQKIDGRLTNLIKKTAVPARMSRAGVRNTEAMQAFQKAAKETYSVEFNADGSVRSIGVLAYLKEGAECPTELLKQMGITVNSTFDNVAFLSVPADRLAELETVDDITLVVPEGKVRVMNMDARKATKADKAGSTADAVAEGLPQAYTGSGVVLSIIDIGIDFNHIAFKNADGTSRVKKAVIFGDGTMTTTKEYTPETISGATTDVSFLSHGTHTAAIAGGSVVTDGSWKWQGVAPEADLVLMGVGQGSGDASICEAMQQVFDYADMVNKPAVVSISMGNLDRLHDGSDVMAKKVRLLTDGGTKAGRVVLMSSGNAADNKMSICKTLGAADADGWQLKALMGVTSKAEGLMLYNSYARASMIVYASDGKDFTAEIGLVNIKTGEVITGKDNVESHMLNPLDPTDRTFLSVFALTKSNDVNAKGNTVVTYNTGDNNACYMDNVDLRLALFVKGVTEGQTINVVSTDDNADEPGFYIPDVLKDKGYTKGMPDIAFNGAVCDESVISVGSYITRLDFLNHKGVEKKNSDKNSKVTGKPQEIGAVSDFSSFGTAENGLAIPTVVAPGHFLLSAYSTYDDNFFKKDGSLSSEANDDIIAKCVDGGNRKNWFAYESGTSMSCPHAAGIIALWMQADPTLTTKRIREIMSQTCIKDEFVTDVTRIPSGNAVQAGYGKIDALAGLKMIKGETAIKTAAADGERQATPATMYSTDAPVYNMLGQKVSKNTPGLVIYKGRKYVNR